MRLPVGYVMDELPMYEGWAFVAWSMENDGWLKFCNVARKSPGYVKQAINKMMKQLDQIEREHLGE